MYHNYFFLKRLAKNLWDRLQGAELIECFSQNKEELILAFHTHKDDFYIKANLEPQIGLLHFSSSFHRAKRNSINLFTEVVGEKVTQVEVFENERSFFIRFSNGYSLIFKMHGSRSNILLEHDQHVIKAFRGSLPNDLSLTWSQLNREVPQSRHAFEESGGLKAFPHVGREILATHFEAQETLSVIWDQLTSLLLLLEKNPISIYLVNEHPVISLLEIDGGKLLLQTQDALEASTFYYERFVKNQDLTKKRGLLIQEKQSEIRRFTSYIEKTELKLNELTTGKNYSHLADLVMANLHLFPKGVQEADLVDFYTQKEVTVKLKPGQTAQAYAEIFYRKAKNQSIELDKLRENIVQKKLALSESETELKSLHSNPDSLSLKDLKKGKKKEEESLPYHPFEYKGYQIMVGKNGAHNDQLTHRIATKNDLWLHARDTPGSHVIIRHQAGENLPSDVLEKAAQLAAWNSKRKNDSLCPVIYTEKKNVRKIKGALPGQAKVAHEKIIMVVPAPF